MKKPIKEFRDTLNIDYAYGAVYIYSDEQQAYIFECSFYAIGALNSDSEYIIAKKLYNRSEV